MWAEPSSSISLSSIFFAAIFLGLDTTLGFALLAGAVALGNASFLPNFTFFAGFSSSSLSIVKLSLQYNE